MISKPSGTSVLHEVECALARSKDPDLRKAGNTPFINEFFDRQRILLEQGQWSAQSFYLDRTRLSLTSKWRQLPVQSREQVMACLVQAGQRVAHAEDMKSLWGQLYEVGQHMVDALPLRQSLDFASRVLRRQQIQGEKMEPSHPTRPKTCP